MFCAGDMVLIGAGGSLQWWNIVLGEHMNIRNFQNDMNYVSFQMRDRLYKKMKKNGNLDTKKIFRKIKHHILKLLRQSYWQYIENIVTPKETEGTFNSMKKFSTYIKHQKTYHL